MTQTPIIDSEATVWRRVNADRLAIIVDGAEYFRAVKSAILQAKEQVLMVGWDFDTRIPLEPGGPTMEGPNELGDFLNWIIDERPEVEMRILKWNLGMVESLKRGETPLFILEWMTRDGIELKLDAAHPPGASHHQKIIVIDDAVAFCGGIDVTKGRWDTRAHRDDDPERTDTHGKPLKPWHDATTCSDGEIAHALGLICRERWRRATGEEVAEPEGGNAPWPDGIEPAFRDVEVGISRTNGAFDEYEQVSEIERMTLAMIAEARETLYIESQYFASRKIAEAICKRLSDAKCPEIVLINPQSQDGWLEEKTMGSARSKLLHMVRQADAHDRFRLYYPVTEGGNPIYVHAKIMIADDRALKIGSANLNNRSMGLDTECDLSVSAEPDDAELRLAIRNVRDDLLCEHLGVDRQTLTAKLQPTGSLIATIEAFGDRGRGLRELPAREVDAVDETLREGELFDPERPGKLIDRMKGWVGAD
ncbi:phospholipase D-like domain-containing protein [Jannaschia sp. S6380]|uniref:phospholipase D-like domain-containing protein n=1 Tax=Jannaschia sp. S6380 TaxID=2926408 RepID=UPI001FF6618E|nr:phospholipase D-like domain-containing protein [Jannaschia sp. S6380]MCK0166721.1 phospholipase D-like domain-containing protein [Jannaschia sp. S6380]